MMTINFPPDEDCGPMSPRYRTYSSISFSCQLTLLNLGRLTLKGKLMLLCVSLEKCFHGFTLALSRIPFNLWELWKWLWRIDSYGSWRWEGSSRRGRKLMGGGTK